MRAATYSRISSDPDDKRAGVDRQQADAGVHAERQGYSVVEEFVDNDRSGFKESTKRPGFEALKDAIARGAVDVVIYYHQDRLARNTTVFTEFLDLCRDHDVRMEPLNGPPVDSITAQGRFSAKNQANADEWYSASLSEKGRRAQLEKARKGLPNGGGRGGRPFGFEKGGMKRHATEARVVKKLYRKLLAGASVRSLATWLNESGFTTTTGNTFKTRAVRDLLSSPRYAGLRQHQGEVIGVAAWPALVAEDEWRRTQTLLSDPSRRSYKGGPRRYLLTSGLAVCGRCGTKMVARPQNRKRRYGCKPTMNGGCGANRIEAQPLEDLVRDAVFDVLATPDILNAMAGAEHDEPDDLLSTLADLIARQERLAVDHYVEQRISEVEYFAAREPLEAQIAEVKKRLAADEGTRVLAGLPAGAAALHEWWDRADVSLRRELVAAVVGSVTIKSAVRGRNFFDPDRVDITWRA